uniref:Protein-export membrane protein SecG n=1 Tax=Eubacterium cellulosolvens (strain ATCC 43171 / JCM 9499 / 6) TaxID=633697 RepID=I5ARA7_EUBC6
MAILRTVLTVLFALDCIGMIIVILMQQGKDRGLGAIAGVSNNTETYWSKNKGRSKEGNLIRITRILAILFFALSVVLNIKF